MLVLGGTTLLPATAAAAGRQRPWTAALAGYLPLLRVPRVRQLATLRFLTTCSWGTTSLLWPLLLARLSGDPATAALFGTVSMVVAVAAQLGTGRLIDSIGPGVPALTLACLVPLVAALAALAIAANSSAALFATGIAGTAVAWSLSGTSLPLIRAAASADAVGQVVGLLHLLWSLAMLGGTLVAGWLVVLNPALPFWAVTLMSLPAAVAAYRLWRVLRRAAPATELRLGESEG
jgi:MFS family permease